MSGRDGKDAYDYDWLSHKLEHHFQRNVSFLSLSTPHWHLPSFCGEDPHEYWPRLRDMSNLIKGASICKTESLISYMGQFIVSRHAVLQKPARVYAALQAPFLEPADSRVHQPQREPFCERILAKSAGQVDVSNPCYGHSIERIWPMLFNCDDTSILADCKGRGFCGCHLASSDF